MFNTTESPPVELVFRPARKNEIHSISLQGGRCPQSLLEAWTHEFQPFFEKNQHTSQELTFHFRSAEPGIPTTYRVRFEREGRNTTAWLTSAMTPPSEPQPMAPPEREILPEDTRPTDRDWRVSMLTELDEFITLFATDPPERQCLQFVWQRLSDLATERPQHFTLMVFAAFIAAAHTETLQEQDPFADHMYQAAAALLERAVTESEFGSLSEPGPDSRYVSVWTAITRIIEKFVPPRR